MHYKKKRKAGSVVMLAPQEIRELRQNLHHLKPVVIIGNNGLSDAVIQEINRALDDHELIKVRASVENREQLTTLTTAICAKTDATHVQTIGHIIAIYRKNLQVEEA